MTGETPGVTDLEPSPALTIFGEPPFGLAALLPGDFFAVDVGLLAGPFTGEAWVPCAPPPGNPVPGTGTFKRCAR